MIKPRVARRSRSTRSGTIRTTTWRRSHGTWAVGRARSSGRVSSVDLEQPLTPANEPPTSYWFKVIDDFGEYAEATTKITVADTTKPIVTAPADRTVECSGHSGTQVLNLGSATATDTCDGSLPRSGTTHQRSSLEADPDPGHLVRARRLQQLGHGHPERDHRRHHAADDQREAVASGALAARPQARADHRDASRSRTSVIRTRPSSCSRSRATSRTMAWATVTRPTTSRAGRSAPTIARSCSARSEAGRAAAGSTPSSTKRGMPAATRAPARRPSPCRRARAGHAELDRAAGASSH